MPYNPIKRISSDFAWFLLPAIAVVLAVPSNAYADGISLISASLNASGLTSTGPGTLTCDQCLISTLTGLPEDVFSTVTASYDGVTSSSVTGNGSANGGGGSAGEAFLLYDFDVVGSVPDVTTVPVIVHYTLLSDETAATGSSASAYAFISVGGIGSEACSFTYVVAGSGCGIGSQVLINESTTYYATPGSTVPINIRMEGLAFNGTWAATADPSLEIDPSFPDAADFTLEVSPIPPSSTVPEPSYSLLLGAGLLALAIAGKYKRFHTKSGGADHKSITRIPRRNYVTRVSLNFAWPILLASATGLTAPVAAYADLVPAASISLVVASIPNFTSNTVGTIAGTFCTTDGGCAAGFASASYAGSSGFSVSAYGVGGPAGSGSPGSVAQASLTFYLELIPLVPALTSESRSFLRPSCPYKPAYLTGTNLAWTKLSPR